MASHKVTVYTRVNRQDQPAYSHKIYPTGTIFFLRFKRRLQRVQEETSS